MLGNKLVRHAITGAPGAGKSTLLDELSRRGISTRAEVARAILREPGGMDLRRENPEEFAMAMFAAEAINWQQAGSLLVCDRGLPDIVGFLNVEGIAVPAGLDRACRDLRYAEPIFRAPPWSAIYTQDEERIQSWDDAVESDAAVCEAWQRFGYDLIDLPFASVDKRVDFVLEVLDTSLSNS